GVDGDALLLEAIEFTVGGVDIAAEGHLLPGEKTEALAIQGHMKEEADNRYQGLSLDGIGITVFAAQDTVEYDSIDNQYDANAEYLNLPIAVVDDLDTTNLPVALDVAKVFTIDEGEAADVTEAYKDYNADFVISFSNAVNAGDVKVAGQYDSYSPNWVVEDCPALAADQEYRLLADGLNMTMTYAEVRDYVQTFNCGAAANGVAEGTVMTVALNIYSPEGQVINIGSYTYTF
ncbi:MAG: hypothetical protein IK085_00785, partial [Clostridia bacterium]|nr:hypothetical protein [Clostridia bacterium]